MTLRSWLYVPGHRPDLIEKALRGKADAVVLDLEDAVPAAEKNTARATVLAMTARSTRKPVWVRINDLAGPYGEEDLDWLAGVPVAGVRLSKCEDPETVREAGERLGLPMQLLLETATGVERAGELARAHVMVCGIGLGETDLVADLHARSEDALTWCRSRVVVAARAARLPAPVQSVWTHVDNLDGLRQSTVRARESGFFGRSVVHPSQVPIVNEVFTPNEHELRAARELVAEVGVAEERGHAAYLDNAGCLVDPAVVARAKWTLTLASQLDGQENNA